MSTPLLRRLTKSFSSNTARFFANFWPPFRCTGIKIEEMSQDYRCVRVSLKLRWFNRNYVGTHFGGSIFAMTDPFYMVMLINNLGNDYVVWDKAAHIEFKKPGRGTLYANFLFSAEEIDNIKQQANEHEKYIFDKPIDVLNEQGEIVASVIKTLYVRRRDTIHVTPHAL